MAVIDRQAIARGDQASVGLDRHWSFLRETDDIPGGALFPILINFLLSRTGGFRWTLRILACILAVCGGVALLGVKPRLPVAPVHSGAHVTVGVSPDFRFFKNPLFIAIVSAHIYDNVAPWRMLMDILASTEYHHSRASFGVLPSLVVHPLI